MKIFKKTLLAVCSMLLAAASLNATSITFGAQIANNLAGVGGAALPAGGPVEVGTWDGSNFITLGTTTNDNLGFVGPGDGFFGDSVATFNSAGIAGSQLAMRWSDGVNTGILYFSGGGEWDLKGGDGGGTDFNSNTIDVADLTVGGAGSVLNGEAVLIGATFAGSNIVGVPSFQLTAVPEPSSFALLAGCFGLVWVMVRRRS